MKRTEIEETLIDLWHICGKSYLHKLRTGWPLSE